MYAFHEACSILNSHNLLKRSYEFTDKRINNYTIYSHQFQFESKKVLEEIRGRAVALKQSQSLIFHAGIYVFVMCVVPDGEIIILATHPIHEELHGNGNGLLVMSKPIDEIFAWIFKRASRAYIMQCHASKSMSVTLNHILVTYFLPQISDCICVLDLWAKVI